MDETKFRVWDIEHKRMCSVEDMEWHTRGLTVEWRRPDKKAGVLFPDEYILMQYTGLKDMTAQAEELYAGDILKGDSPLGAFESDYPRRNIGVIVWHDQKAVWCLEWQDVREFKMRPLLHEMISRYNRKIGNIFENPDLLEAPNRS